MGTRNPISCAMLNDFYQFTIARAYYEEGRQDEPAVFDLFTRTNPFKGTYTVLAGIKEAVSMIASFKFSEDDLEYIKDNLPSGSDGFIDYLRNIDISKLRIVAPKEGTIVFPREPFLRVEGPIALCQILETPLLNAINFATLMTTNSSRFRLWVGNKGMMEFGLRRAQGPDGALSATRYSYIGGFDSTSNVLAGKLYGIPCVGTVAHSFVTSFYNKSQLHTTMLNGIDIYDVARQCIDENGWKTNEGELAAFVSQAITYPTNFLALVDSYSTLDSGVPNFLAVSLGLHKAGFRGKGIRLDSGDPVELSRATRKMFIEFGEKYSIEYAKDFCITASNDINEGILKHLKEVGHEINVFGIGTHLVTCQAQPALGGVYKLVEINGVPRVKLSNTLEKSTIPAKKDLYRLYDSEGKELIDLLTLSSEAPPTPGHIVCYSVFPKEEKIEVDFSSLTRLYDPIWENGTQTVSTIEEARAHVSSQLKSFRSDIVGVENTKDFTVAVSDSLHAVRVKLMEEALE